MELSTWTYEGPPHVGAMRVATAMQGVHYVLHAPQGDTYADLLFTMIERRGQRPPVTYTTFRARDLGADTAELFKAALAHARDRFRPELILAGASCTAELLQDDPGGLAKAAGVPVIPLDLPAYSKKEGWGAAETFRAIVRALAVPCERRPRAVNILGPTALGFRHRDDLREVLAIVEALGLEANVIAPLGAAPADIARLGAAAVNVVLYPEVADPAARWLERQFGQARTTVVPIGIGATRDFIAELSALAGVDPAPALAEGPGNLPWWSRSVDSLYLTAKRVFVFGDATHAIAIARMATDEFGFELAGLGTFDRTFAREVRAAAAAAGVEATITDDHLEVEAAIAAAAPELVLGTQMERHVAKRLGIACAVISAPAHVQDYPARHSPLMGWEGANVLWDTCVHPLVMGLEEHLLTLFRGDAEFHDEAGPSHLPAATPAPVIAAIGWAPDAERELGKIPFFVRGKARRNTEAFARERGADTITLDTLYEAKAHYAH